MDVASFQLQSPQEFPLWPQFLTLQAESKSCLLSEGAFLLLSCIRGQMGNVCDEEKRVLKPRFPAWMEEMVLDLVNLQEAGQVPSARREVG